MKKYFGIAATSLLLLAACSDENAFQDSKAENNEVAVDIKYERSATLASATYNAEAIVSKTGQETITSDLDIDEESIEGIIKNIPNGDDWNVEIIVKDENGDICFKGLDIIDLKGDKKDIHTNLFGTNKEGKIDVTKDIIVDSTMTDGDLSDGEIDALIDAIFDGTDADLQNLIKLIKEVIAGKNLDKGEIIILKEMILDFLSVLDGMDGDWDNIDDKKDDWKDKDWDKGDWKDGDWCDKDSIDWDKDSIDWDKKDSTDWDKDSIDWDKDSIDWDKDSIDWDKKDSTDWDKDALLGQDAINEMIVVVAKEYQVVDEALYALLKEKSDIFATQWTVADKDKVWSIIKEFALYLKKDGDNGDWGDKDTIDWKDTTDWKDTIDWDKKDSTDWDDKDWDKDTIDWDKKDTIDWDKDSIDWDKKDTIDGKDDDLKDLYLTQDDIIIMAKMMAEEYQVSTEALLALLKEKSDIFTIKWKVEEKEKVFGIIKEFAMLLKKDGDLDKGDWDNKDGDIEKDSTIIKK